MSHPKDSYNGVEIEVTLAPIVEIKNGTTVECAIVENDAAVLHALSVGISGDTLSGALYYTGILQHGDVAAGTDMAAVTDAGDYIGTMVDATTGKFAQVDAAAEDPAIFYIGYRGTKRYSRILLTFVGNHSTGTPMEAFAVKTNSRFQGASGLLPTA